MSGYTAQMCVFFSYQAAAGVGLSGWACSCRAGFWLAIYPLKQCSPPVLSLKYNPVLLSCLTSDFSIFTHSCEAQIWFLGSFGRHIPTLLTPRSLVILSRSTVLCMAKVLIIIYHYKGSILDGCLVKMKPERGSLCSVSFIHIKKSGLWHLSPETWMTHVNQLTSVIQRVSVFHSICSVVSRSAIFAISPCRKGSYFGSSLWQLDSHL